MRQTRVSLFTCPGVCVPRHAAGPPQPPGYGSLLIADRPARRARQTHSWPQPSTPYPAQPHLGGR
jgi:hypothetical protein